MTGDYDLYGEGGEEDEAGEMDCYYGLSEFCEDAFARDTGCTVNCALYLKSCEEALQ